MDCVKERAARQVKNLGRWWTGHRFNRLAGAVLFAFAATGYQPATGGAQSDTKGSQSFAPSTGTPAPDFELKTLDGQVMVLEKFRGRPLVMNFFASWCDPCREEMPLLNELAAKAPANGYAIVGIAVQDSRAALTEFAKASGIAFPIALDFNSKVQRAYRVFGPPATFFIDRQGIIRDVVLGPITAERAREALDKVGVRE